MSLDQSNDRLVDHLFRHEYGKMVAVLSRFLGLKNLDYIEDIVQETFASALLAWRSGNLPTNPSAWLMQVAKRKAIDVLRKRKSTTDLELNIQLGGPASVYVEELFLESEIADSQLRMIFACCHPSLKRKDQIALTLKIVSGFGHKEIANALLMGLEQTKKRVQRAIKFLRQHNIELRIPQGDQLAPRLENVHLALYLLFNEGYYATKGAAQIRRDLCIEAMRLTKLLIGHPSIPSASAHAILALMTFHAARFDSRINDSGDIVLLEDQNRSLWDRELIKIAESHFQKATIDGLPSAYHVEAAIAREHAMSASFERTNWLYILDLYDKLYTFRPDQLVLLNQIIVLMQLGNTEDAESLFTSLEPNQSGTVLYHSVGAEIYLRKGDYKKSLDHLKSAEMSSPSPAELRLLQRKKDDLRVLL